MECPCDLCADWELKYEDANEMCGECTYMALLDIMRNNLECDLVTEISAYKDDFYFNEENVDDDE